MKSFTDIKQSKRLAEILPPESADMYYEDDVSIEVGHAWHPQHTPCWSLAALLNELGRIKEHWFYHLIFDFTLNKYSVEVEADFWRYEGDLYDNAIDAVYEVILKLHEQKSK